MSSSGSPPDVPPKGTPQAIITIENITVRPVVSEDAENMAYHANNRKIWLRMSHRFPFPYRVEDGVGFIRMATDDKSFAASGPFDNATGLGTGPRIPIHYAICIDGAYIGGIGCDWMDGIRTRSAEFGYWIGEEHWQRGIMGRVVPLFVQWLFATFDRLLHLEAVVYAGNPGSCRVLELAGLRHAYLDRKRVWKDGHAVDCDVYVRVRDD